MEERKHRLRDFTNMELKKVRAFKREEATGGWRKLHHEELRDLCCSSNIIRVFRLRKMRRVGHVGGRFACRVLLEK
jgi:hypothetical protein